MKKKKAALRVLAGFVSAAVLTMATSIFGFEETVKPRVEIKTCDGKLPAVIPEEDEVCRHRTPRLLNSFEAASRSTPILWSYPGSGNSYLRLLVEQSTGYLTGSVYHKDQVMKDVFKGETHCDGAVIGIKSHKKVPKRCEGVEGNPRVAVLIRHPVRTFFAEYSRKVSTAPNRHIAGIDRDKFNLTDFTRVSLEMATQWVEQIPWRLRYPPQGEYHVLRFEDMAHKKLGFKALTGLLTFLDVCTPSQEVIACAYRKANHPLIRRKPTADQVTLEEILPSQLLDKIWEIVEPIATRWNYTKSNWRK